MMLLNVSRSPSQVVSLSVNHVTTLTVHCASFMPSAASVEGQVHLTWITLPNVSHMSVHLFCRFT